jgi:hypothetical protein
MPNIPWAVGERETFEAARESGLRRLAFAQNVGNIAGTSIKLYKNEKDKDQQFEYATDRAAEYDRIDGQTAEELARQDEEDLKEAKSADSASVVSDTAVEGTKDEPPPHTSRGVPSPGTGRSDVQTSQQPPGSKPATATQQGATGEGQPPPATKEESADEESALVRGATDQDPTPNKLHKVATQGVQSSATSPKNFGTYVVDTKDAVIGAAKAAAGKISRLGGGRFLQRIGNIIGMEDPLRNQQLSRLAKFEGRGMVRQEEQKRAASLQALGAQMAKPGQWLRGVAPFTYRHMPELEGLEVRPSGGGGRGGNVTIPQLLRDAAAGDPVATKAVNDWMNMQGYLIEMRQSGRGGANPTWQNVAMDLIAFGRTREEQERGRRMLEYGQHYGLSHVPAADMLEVMERFRTGGGFGGGDKGPPELPPPGAERPGAPGGGGRERPTPPRLGTGEPGAGGGGGGGGGRPRRPAAGTAEAAPPPSELAIDLAGNRTIADNVRKYVDEGKITPERGQDILRAFPGKENTLIQDLSTQEATLVLEMLAAGKKYKGGELGGGEGAGPESTQPTSTSTTTVPTTTVPTTSTTLKPRGRKMTPEERRRYQQELQGGTAGPGA